MKIFVPRSARPNRLKYIKTSSAPNSEAVRSVYISTSSRPNRTENATKAMTLNPEASPSMPSMRLTELTMSRHRKIVRG